MTDSVSGHLPYSALLTMEGDLAARMVTGIDSCLDRMLDEVVTARGAHWKRDCSSPEAYEKSIETNRQRFADLIGLADRRLPARMEQFAEITAARDRNADAIAVGDGFTVHAIRWPVLKGVDGEGLLLQPDAEPVADVIAVPDCDWTPEMLVGVEPGVSPEGQFARRLVESGCRVAVPVLMNREDTFSGIPGVAMVNQPHREFVYRAAYEVGRYPIGYEVQKIRSLVDWFVKGDQKATGIIGYGEGGLLAMYTAAVDTRIDVTVVSGYFEPREMLYREPIYRNISGLLNEFGDAEIASLIAPRTLIVETCRHPAVSGPPPATGSRSDHAAPGKITTPSPARVKTEFDRTLMLIGGMKDSFHLMLEHEGIDAPGRPATISRLVRDLSGNQDFALPQGSALTVSPHFHADASRQERQVSQVLDHTQYLMRESKYAREDFWAEADRSSVESWVESSEKYRECFRNDVVGRLPDPTAPLNPRTRQVYETDSFTGYEVVIDVFEDVFAYGILLIPKDLSEGERRPVVVCQHGLEGRPQEVADPDLDHEAYHRYACTLAERGYITYAPQNPYIGGHTFRELLRKAHPIKQSLYGFIVRQHERTLEWLASLPYVDPGRLAFYGLSYGGKTAMRIPPLVPQYCLVICSADYNEWVWKNMSTRSPYSYLISREYDMQEFNLANTFNYAEMSWLICPRPFMVERGHDDGVAPDEWVAYEYARTRRHYVKLGIGGRTEMEVFDGPHAINGKGTFEFLDRFLLSK